MKIKRWPILLCIPLSAFILGQGCPVIPGDGDQAGASVIMQDIAFIPDSVTIQAGQKVIWTNEDLVPHTVTSGNPGDADAGEEFESSNLITGATYEHRFDEPGTYTYFCEFHPNQMRDATVIVTP